MKVLPFLFVLAVATISFASEDTQESRIYFSPGSVRPEQVRIGRDVVRWRLGGQLFDEGPCMEGVPSPVLVGTPDQIDSLNRARSAPLQTYGPVRGYEMVLPQFCAPAASPRSAKGAINVTNGYHDEEAVADLLVQFETEFPALAKRIPIGFTHWGRTIWAIKISDNVADGEPEPRVVIDANIHAREYATTEVALDIIWQLLYGYATNATFASWVDGMEIYVIPCLNPDGRFYCDTVNTGWRKNGRDNNRSGTMTYPADGVDLNRNSSFHWGSDDEGSTSTASSDLYRGPRPASEPEIQAYDAFIQRIRPGFTLALHSYEGSIYSPYGDYNVGMPYPDPFRSLGTNIARVCTNDDDSAYVYYSGPEFGYTVNGDRTDANYGLYGIQAYGAEIGTYDAYFQPIYATTRDKLVPGIRLGWQRFLAAAHTNWPKVRGWSIDAASGQPIPVRIHSLNLTNRPNDEHWTSRADGFFECPLPTSGTYRLVFAPIGQPSLASTQTIVVGTTAKSTNVAFAAAPVFGASADSGVVSWSNQNENGTILLEHARHLDQPWLPLLAQAGVGIAGQASIPDSASPFIRARSSPRLLPSNTNLAWVPSGLFQMGAENSNFTNERPSALVHLDGFAVDSREVAFTNWHLVRRWALTNGYHFATGQCGVVAGGGPASSPRHPVVKVSWHDAVKFCNARSQFEGLLPAYYTTPGLTNLYKSNVVGLSSACVDWNANGYRLPTEAEWEKAARGGFTDREYPWDNDVSAANARFSAAGTTNVGGYLPNGYGLHDSAGNAAEWCWDWSGPYVDRSGSNPVGPETGTLRVVRGGSWTNAASLLRCAARDAFSPSSSNAAVGFRCVRR